MVVALNPGDHVIGLDIGGTKTMAVVFDHEFKELGSCRKRTIGKNQKESTEERLFRVIDTAIESAGEGALQAIGAGAPGPTDRARGVVIDTPNLGWKEFCLGKMLSERYNVPAVIENDVNAGTYGEWAFGEISTCKNVLGVFPGTGIGAGLIVDGALLHGFSGSAGEIGHMTLAVDGPLCGCGKRGCLEAIASRLAIAKEVGALAARGDAPYICAHCGTDLRKIRSGALAKAIEAGDQQVEAVVRKAAFYTGIAVANAINLVSPEAVVLGGGLVEAMESVYLAEVQRGIEEHAMPMLRHNVQLVPARLGDYAVALGAARMALE